MRFAIVAVLMMGACRSDDWLPPGAGCPPPDPWTWTDVVRAPAWQAWSQTRHDWGGMFEYRIWAQTARGRVLLFEGDTLDSLWDPPVASGDGRALRFGGRTCALDGAEVRCR